MLAGLIGEIGISSRFTPDEEKSLRAAGRASAATGVPIEVHLPGWERRAIGCWIFSSRKAPIYAIPCCAI